MKKSLAVFALLYAVLVVSLVSGSGEAITGINEVLSTSPGTVGGFFAGQLQVRDPGTTANSNSVITGHNSFGGNTQLWYVGSSSSSNQDIIFRNRQNAALSLGTNNISRLRIQSDGSVDVGPNPLLFGPAIGSPDLGLARETGGLGGSILQITDAAGAGADAITAGAGETPLRLNGYVSGRVQQGHAIPATSGTSLSSSGLIDTVTEVDVSSSLEVTANGNALRQNTGTTLGSVAGWDVGTAIIHFSAVPFVAFQFSLRQTSLSRSFVGISDQTLQTMVGADDPAGNYVGLQARDGDANFFVVHKNGTTLVRTDTSIALDTAIQFLVIDVQSPTNVVVSLLDSSDTLKFQTTITTGLPASGTTFDLMVGTENRSAGAARSIDTMHAVLALRI